MRPSAANYSSSDSDSEESDIDVGPEQDASSESSTHVLTQREMEEGQGEGGGVFSRFRDYAGSFRIKLSNKDRKKLEELESEERYIKASGQNLIKCVYTLLYAYTCTVV